MSGQRVTAPPATPTVECREVTVRYGQVVALDAVDLVVHRGESVAVLGPSGAGKTTLLHVVAGFVAPSAGTVDVSGTRVADDSRWVPAERRRVGMVFQHYALWPHLTAAETVAYPLRRAGIPPADATAQAQRLLEALGVGELGERRPSEMSGGQQQRVGVARALARDAAVFLFDEPTAHLDTALRGRLQEEMSGRRTTTGAAALYSTHDAGEALAIADRVVLLREGRVVQSGAPREIYEEPVDRWAALLTGPASVLDLPGGLVEPGRVELDVAGQPVGVPGGGQPGGGDRVAALVRPDWVALDGPLPGTVRHVWYRGPHTDYRLEVPGGVIDVREPGPPRAIPGQAPGWHMHRVWLLNQSEEPAAD